MTCTLFIVRCLLETFLADNNAELSWQIIMQNWYDFFKISLTFT